jgi:hypothetical protein
MLWAGGTWEKPFDAETGGLGDTEIGQDLKQDTRFLKSD